VNYVFGQDETTTTESTSTTTNATTSKNKKVNWTEVEMKWNEVLDDDIVHEKWKKLDENLKNGKF
jgi:anti-sigma28 factor (negative regulator of flagellin synthesis)